VVLKDNVHIIPNHLSVPPMSSIVGRVLLRHVTMMINVAFVEMLFGLLSIT
jgi:hypothetical protein